MVRTPVVAALVGVVLAAGGCATSASPKSEVVPVGSVGAPAVSDPVPIGDAVPVAQRRGAPAGPRPPVTASDDDPAPAPSQPAEAAPTVPAEPTPAPQPAPSPTPLEPELIVGDDGCVTDLTTGLVITCHDPAAGPDEAASG